MSTKKPDSEKETDISPGEQDQKTEEKKKPPMAEWLKDKLQTKKKKVKEEDPNIYPLF